MKPVIENTIRRINRSINKIEDILEGKTATASELDKGNKRVLNLPSPRDPEENMENHNDSVTAKCFYDATKHIGEKANKIYFEN